MQNVRQNLSSYFQHPTYCEIISSSSGSDCSPFRVHAPDHVDQIDVGVLLPESDKVEKINSETRKKRFSKQQASMVDQKH